ncbi:MAG: hypothetical protein V2I39_14805 [Erythrobacter sp.]|jgi:hypothetical protein|nr:hypothetical protein [Erythrobacter sp.]
MYSFFDQAGQGTQRALAAVGSLIITVVLIVTAIVPASPSYTLAQGVLA